MFYNKWEPIYNKIAKNFNYPLENEEKSANILNKLLENKNFQLLKKLKNLITGKDIVIFGAGPSLDWSLNSKKRYYIDKITIAADGATSALLKYDIKPDIIVTDLDGKISDQIYANNKGSLLIVHAHGDNIEKIKKNVPKFNGDIIGTTQINPDQYENIFNFGGFTDGDRAVFIAEHFQAKTIYLIGFDFNSKIGKYSFKNNKDHSKKLEKLKWCKKLIKSLNRINQNIYFK